MINNKLILPLVLVVVGCNGPTTQYVTLTESGEVYDVAYMPATHGSGTSFNFSDGSFSSTDVNTPATYAVVFKCQHGKFVIEGDRGEAMYRKLSKGEQVVISYNEEWLVDTNAHTHQFIALHFIDANPKQEPENTK